MFSFHTAFQHRLANVAAADNIYVMENGEIVENGTHDELMNLNGKYAYMFNLQAEKYRKGDRMPEGAAEVKR